MTLKENIICTIAATVMTCAILLAAYVGMNNALCRDLHTFTLAEQIAMDLDYHKCAKPWYARL